ncbi:Fpg/Nei family DNA glycosylase [Paenibacillus turpanensis]|uniref:Fpg/Nei family DNA glycosylase n=1 Tax=Paenibacillus turpanensis TaxID=2689078 RepID=UPI00140C5FA2|nr:Fpg/Nei family DNA glycosylase [Paenibacillus turpanensis]
MPELPEMETYRMLLQPLLLGKTITEVQVERVKSVGLTEAGPFIHEVEGRTITGIERRAKHLVFRLDSGKSLLLHLMLGGWMFYGTEEQRPNRTVQVRLSFGDKHLHFIGLRLGYLFLLNEVELERKTGGLGPEPMDPTFTEEAWWSQLRSRRGVLKPVLTDQKVFSGIGNCYADEICFDAELRPDSPISSLSDDHIRTLYSSMRSVLREAIVHGGYMEYPLYEGDLHTGGYNDRCRVYDRGGEPCVRCGGPITQEQLSGRKVFYCLRCQELPSGVFARGAYDRGQR